MAQWKTKTWGVWIGLRVATPTLAGLLLAVGGEQRVAEWHKANPGLGVGRLPDLVATINGRAIGRAAVEERLRGLEDPQPEDVRDAVARLLEEVLLEEAVVAMRRTGASDGLDDPDATLQGMMEIPREEVQRYWSDHPRVFRWDFYGVRRMTLATREEARRVRRAVAAQTESEEPSRDRPEGGRVLDIGDMEMEWIGPGELSPEMELAVVGLRPGEVTDPLPQEGRYEVIQLVARRPAQEASFEDWEPRLRRYLQAERWHRERVRWVRLREAYAQVDVAPGVPFVSARVALDFFRRTPEVVAVVNGTPITWDRLRERLIQWRRMGGREDDQPVYAGEFRQLLGKLIESTLIREEARKLGVSVSDDEVEERYRAFRSGFASDEELEAVLRASATSLAAWRRDTRYGLLLLKTEEAMMRRITVTPEEIQRYWDENPAAFPGQQLEDHLDHIRTIIQRTRWLQEERVRWVLSLLERGTNWNRLDLTLKLGEPVPRRLWNWMGATAGIVVVARARQCREGLCETVGREWQEPVPLHVMTGSRADEVVDTWRLPSLPWAFAVNASGRVSGEYPGPLTDQALSRLARALQSEDRQEEAIDDR